MWYRTARSDQRIVRRPSTRYKKTADCDALYVSPGSDCAIEPVQQRECQTHLFPARPFAVRQAADALHQPANGTVRDAETLGDLLQLAGGVANGRSLQAILLGGAAGTFVGPEALAMPLTLEDTRAAGATLGSGAVIVIDDTVDLERMLLRIAAFFRHESCGQCVPCRVGTVRQRNELEHKVQVWARSQLPWLAKLGSIRKLAEQ